MGREILRDFHGVTHLLGEPFLLVEDNLRNSVRAEPDIQSSPSEEIIKYLSHLDRYLL